MPFKNDKQRKGFFANQNNPNNSHNTYYASKNKKINRSVNPINKKKLVQLSKSKTLDSDGDGVVNSKDCKPFDPKKQGFFHDMQIKLLKKKEEFVEGQREREQKKLNDLRDKVKEKTAVSLVTENKRKQDLAQKQAVIDEIKAEKNKLSKIRAENEKAKRELEKGTFTEKVKQLSVKAYNSGIDYLSEKKKPKRRKTKTKKVKTKIVYVDVNTGKPIKHKRKKKKKEVYYGYRF